VVTLSQMHGVNDDIIHNLLNQKTRYHGEFLRARRFLDLVEGQFQIDEIININRKNDEHIISNKSYDFSIRTIRFLLERGYNDAREILLSGF
jgi:NTE family protein